MSQLEKHKGISSILLRLPAAPSSLTIPSPLHFPFVCHLYATPFLVSPYSPDCFLLSPPSLLSMLILYCSSGCLSFES